jgi:hypothetical protein
MESLTKAFDCMRLRQSKTKGLQGYEGEAKRRSENK